MAYLSSKNPYEEMIKSANTPAPVVNVNQVNNVNPVNRVSTASVPTTLTAEELSKPPVNLPPADNTNLTASTMAGYQKQIDDLNKQIQSLNTTPELTTTVNERSGLTQTLKQQLASLVGLQGNRTQELSAQAGLPEQQKQLSDLTQQAINLNAQYESTKANLEGQGRGIPIQVLSAQQNRLAKQQAIEVGRVTALAQAIQGNISLAQQNIKDTVALEFSDAENQINGTLQLLDLNYQDMTDAEKRRADEQAQLLEQQKTVIADQKAEKENIGNLALEAAKNGADTSTLQEILNSPDLNSAIIKAGNYLSTATDTAPKKIGTDANGQDLYFDPTTQSVITADQLTSSATGLVSAAGGDTYDVSSYATDPNHEASVQSILNNIGKLNNLNEVQNYIDQTAPGSPITAQMISKTSQKYGVSWEALLAMMQQDSSLGTKGKAVYTYNPGNVGNTDSGATKNYGNWQSGVDAVGNWLANHKATQKTGNYDTIFNIVSSQLPGIQQKQVRTAYDELKKTSDDASLKNYLVSLAVNSANAQQQTEYYGREQAYQALQTIDNLLQQYRAAGGDTNVFVGTEEQIRNKVGNTKDPQLAVINNQILQAFVNYRRSLTGVAFSPAESKTYEKIFPEIGKQSEFNESLIKSVEATLLRNQKIFFNTVLGGQANTEKIFGNAFADTLDNQNKDTTTSDTTTNSSTGFWSKVGNFLWGND